MASNTYRNESIILTNSEKSYIIDNISDMEIDNKFIQKLKDNRLDYLLDGNIELKLSRMSGARNCDNSETCVNKIIEYKKICNKVWNKDCYSDMDVAHMKKISNDAKTCADLRKDFQETCCQYTDKGHKGAIDKMEKLHKKCETLSFENLIDRYSKYKDRFK